MPSVIKIFGILFFLTIHFLNSQTIMSDQELEKLLRSQSNIEELHLMYSEISNGGLIRLKNIHSLSILDLTGCRKISDVGLACLRDLTNLSELNLSDTKVTDAGLAHIEGLINLATLDLSVTEISDKGLVHLKNLTKLFRLNLGGTKITDAGLAHFKNFANLIELNISGTKINN